MLWARIIAFPGLVYYLFYLSIFQFVAVEGILTPIKDLFPKQLYRPKSRMFLAAGYCGIAFLLGLSMVTQVN